MTDNLPVQHDRINNILELIGEPTPQPASPPVRRSAHDHRTLPPDAYIRPTLGDLPLSARLRDAIRMFAEVLQPMVDNFEASRYEVLVADPVMDADTVARLGCRLLPLAAGCCH